MKSGDDKEAAPCLHPGLEVRDFPGRGALLVTPFGYWGLGHLKWLYIIYSRQQVSKSMYLPRLILLMIRL